MNKGMRRVKQWLEMLIIFSFSHPCKKKSEISSFQDNNFPLFFISKLSL